MLYPQVNEQALRAHAGDVLTAWDRPKSLKSALAVTVLASGELGSTLTLRAQPLEDMPFFAFGQDLVLRTLHLISPISTLLYI